MNRTGAALVCCVLTGLASLMLARVHPFGNASLTHTADTGASTNDLAGVPPAVQSLLNEKCSSCHSNYPHAPLYGQFAPVSWLLERDVMRARRAMNLSDWGSYQPEQRQILLAKIAHEAKSGDMPPLQYRLIHWRARITASDLRLLADIGKESERTQAGTLGAGAGDSTRGEALFVKRCTGCHALAGNHEGPRLQGVYGRTSGTVSDFAYSAALKQTHIVWDENSLEKWLTDPDVLIPGNEMDFLVPNAQDRRDIVSYLRRSSGK